MHYKESNKLHSFQHSCIRQWASFEILINTSPMMTQSIRYRAHPPIASVPVSTGSNFLKPYPLSCKISSTDNWSPTQYSGWTLDDFDTPQDSFLFWFFRAISIKCLYNYVAIYIYKPIYYRSISGNNLTTGKNLKQIHEFLIVLHILQV